MVDIQTVSILVASASIVAGVIYYSLQIRHQNKARQTDLIIRLYSLVSSNEFLEAWEKIYYDRELKSYDDYKKKYGSYVELNKVSLVYGALGMLLHKRLVDVVVINDVIGGTVTMMWEKLKPIWKPILKERGIEWDSFEYLANEMKKIEKRRGVKSG